MYTQGLNIDSLSRLSGRVSLHREDSGDKASVELSVRGKPNDINAMRASFMEISQAEGVDIAFQEDNIHRRNRRLVCFDMILL